jgi:hypothetical protein
VHVRPLLQLASLLPIDSHDVKNANLPLPIAIHTLLCKSSELAILHCRDFSGPHDALSFSGLKPARHFAMRRTWGEVRKMVSRDNNVSNKWTQAVHPKQHRIRNNAGKGSNPLVSLPWRLRASYRPSSLRFIRSLQSSISSNNKNGTV